MADRFDPYHKWLSIPPKDQPPNHYRLLGVELFESDAEVIEAAADRQMAHLRTYQIGKHAAESQKLLNEISAAKITLLTAEKKHAYDTALRASQAPAALPRTEPIAPVATKLPAPMAARSPAQAPVRAVPLPVAAPLDFAETAAPFPRRSTPRARPTPATWQKPAMALGAAALLGALFLVLSKPASDATVADREPLAEVEPKTAEAAVGDSGRTNSDAAKRSAAEIDVREPDRNAKIAEADPPTVDVVISNADPPRVDEVKAPKPASSGPSGEPQPSAPTSQADKPATNSAGEFKVEALIGKVSISNDGKTVLLNCDGVGRLFEVRSGRELGQPRPNSVVTGFLPDGQTPFTAPWEGALVLLNSQTGDKAGDGIGGFQVKSLAFSADGRLVAIGGLRGTVTVSELASRQQKPLTAFDRSHAIEGIAFSPDARRVLAASPDGSAKWLDVAAGDDAGVVEAPISTKLAVLPDGRILSAAPNGGSAIEVRDGSTGKIIALWDGHTAHINDLAVSNSGLLVTVAADHVARHWDTASGKSTVLWQNDGELSSVAFSADGKNLAIASRDGRLRYWLGWTGRH